MKLTVNPKALAEAAATVKAATDSRASISALGSTLLSADGESLSLTCTDLDTWLKLTVPAKVEQPGAVLVNAMRAAQVLAMFPDSDLEVSCEKKLDVTMQQGRRVKLMPGADPKEFPPTPTVEVGASTNTPIVFPIGALSDTLKRLSHAISNDPSRYIFNGVSMQAVSGLLELAATDGKRMRVESLAIPFSGAVVIPAKTVKLLISLGAECEVSMSFSENLAAFWGGNWHLSSKLIEGSYPNYRNNIPRTLATGVKYGREAMIDAIRFAALSVDWTNKISVTAGESGVSVEAISEDNGRGATPVEGASGSAEIAFNYNYLIDAIASFQDSDQYIEVLDSMSPATIRSASGLAVISPIRTT